MAFLAAAAVCVAMVTCVQGLSIKPDQKPYLDYLQNQIEKRFCEYDGQRYKPGERVPTTECKTCWCPRNGGPLRCAAAGPCRTPQCVNSVAVEGQCCPVCPTGDNCWARGKLIPARQFVLIRATLNCHMVCKCPGRSLYEKDGANTKAECFNPC